MPGACVYKLQNYIGPRNFVEHFPQKVDTVLARHSCMYSQMGTNCFGMLSTEGRDIETNGCRIVLCTLGTSPSGAYILIM